MLLSVFNASRQKPIPSVTAGLGIVELSDSNRSYGLHRVKRYETRSIVLDHGAFSFRVGMHLVIEDYSLQLSSSSCDTPFQQRATVVENDREGIRLVW